MLSAFFEGNAIWFGVPALAGTIIFLIRIILMMTGTHGLDFDTDTDMAIDGHDSTGAFKAISVQSIIAFAMGFGWAGLAAMHTFKWDMPATIASAVGGGLFVMWLFAVMLRAVADLQSSGNIDFSGAVGSEADVYVTVPSRGSGRGQVKLVIQDRMRIVNAESEGDAFPSQSRVRVVKVNDDNSVTVAAVS